ncbi:hypothetical protein AVEN_134716-1, partial [Araneus ventricosus]
SQLKSEAEECTEELRVWTTVKRSRKFRLQFWEPFFIGTRDDPEFHPHLSWEGKRNKMQVAYEMCLRNYDFHIVENAFLVHSPGINVYNATKEKFRLKYQYENDRGRVLASRLEGSGSRTEFYGKPAVYAGQTSSHWCDVEIWKGGPSSSGHGLVLQDSSQNIPCEASKQDVNQTKLILLSQFMWDRDGLV